MTRLSLALFISIIFFSGCKDAEVKKTYNLKSPAGENARLPFLTADKNGTMFLSWVETDSSDAVSTLRYAKLTGENWSAPTTIASSSQWFVNWADYPSIVAEDGAVTTAHALHKIKGDTYSYNVNIFQNKGNNEWSGPVTPHYDSTETEHGFVSMVPLKNDVMAVWLDGRRSANRAEQEYFDIEKAMTLRSAIISRNGKVIASKQIDKAVCDCCSTSLALTSKGPVVAYRNRTDNEIRDIYVSRYVQGKWTPPTPVAEDNWHIGACPVNGPAVAAHDSTVVIAWYTAAGEKKRVKVARSTNFGQTFSAPAIIQNSKAIGRVDIVLDKDKTAYISWMTQAGQQAELRVAALKPEGSLGRSYTVTTMRTDRKSGFPQMEIQKDHLIFAWTNLDRDKTSVVTARHALSEIK